MDYCSMKVFLQRNFPNLRYAYDKQPRLFVLSIIQSFLPGQSDEIKQREN